MARHPGRQPTDEERRAAYEAVRGAVGGTIAFPPGALETAQFLLNEAKAAFERTTARSDTFEAKATTLLGIVAGGSGAVGVLTLSRVGTGAPIRLSPLLLAALCFIVLTLLSVLYILRSKRLREIDVAPYLSTEMAVSDHRIPLALVLAGQYVEMDDRLRLEAKNEPRILLVAYAATAIGAALIVLHASWAQPANAIGADRPVRPSGQLGQKAHVPGRHPAGTHHT
jgi:hypothetical protein